MANNSELSIDNLIKRIYKSYIEIKVGEFREIDRDMLLSDIGLLYTNIKDLYPSQKVSPIELDLTARKKKEDLEIYLEDNLIERLDIQLAPNLKPESIEKELIVMTPESPAVDIPAVPSIEHKVNELDLAIFEDSNAFEGLSNKKTTSLLDKKSDNTSSPILTEFRTNTANVKPEIKDFKEVPIIEPVIFKTNSPTLKTQEVEAIKEIQSLPEVVIQDEKLEPEKKNATNIIDFLHHDEKKNLRDIYSFLDINTRIGLVELFFKGNSMELTECLVKLNKLETREESLKVIDNFAATFGVEDTEEIYKQFVHLIDRKLRYDA